MLHRPWNPDAVAPLTVPPGLRRWLCLLSLLVLSLGVQAAPVQGPAPDFTLPSNGAGNMRLSELRGQVVMLNFWASWCGPCRQEMPLLDSLYQRYQPLGFTLLGVNVEEDTAMAKRFLADLPVSFPVLFDAENKVTRAYAVKAMPSSVLIDRDGRMRYLHQGYQPGDEATYASKVRELLRE